MSDKMVIFAALIVKQLTAPDSAESIRTMPKLKKMHNN